MTDEPESLPQLTDFVRIFLEDGSYADARLIGPWEAFVFQLITNDCVITSTVWINRSSITKMIKMQATTLPETVDNIVAFPEPKGSA